ncbi:hypothetical protein GIB67_024830 [Kingdonia uniflora]|uniref:Uncharacterized protein n=1 Tax=Kingdonia uniflora TaxID=39325 RepID=A0A7J7NZ51_9MAGN|nr:hypothetical protein GIB67_024830 [Kingdonia uniflora]
MSIDYIRRTDAEEGDAGQSNDLLFDDHHSSRLSFLDDTETSFRRISDVNSTTREITEDEVELHWAALERLPTYEQLRTSLFDQSAEDEKKRVIDVRRLGALERRIFVDKLIGNIEEDNRRLLEKFRERIDNSICLLPPLVSQFLKPRMLMRSPRVAFLIAKVTVSSFHVGNFFKRFGFGFLLSEGPVTIDELGNVVVAYEEAFVVVIGFSMMVGEVGLRVKANRLFIVAWVGR